MKHFILTVLLGIMSIFGVNANTTDPNTNYLSDNVVFSKVIVEAPCRLIYGVADTTFVSITNRDSLLGARYEITNDVLYIKPTKRYDVGFDLEKNKMPVVRIINKDTMPDIKYNRSSFEMKIIKKRNIEKSNETVNYAKN